MVEIPLKHASKKRLQNYQALEEVLGPLENPRYIISRPAMHMKDTWLTKLLPEVLAKFLRRAERSIQMYPTVPSIVANTKDRAEVFKKTGTTISARVKLCTAETMRVDSMSKSYAEMD